MAEQSRLHPPAQTDFEAANSATPDTDRLPAWDDEGWDAYLWAVASDYRIEWYMDHGDEEAARDEVEEFGGYAVDWWMSHRADPRAVAIADRHYNRQKIGSPQFVPPGRCVVLLTADASALWVTSAPFAEYVKHAWAGAWVCSCFRNESNGRYLSSDLIRQAVAVSRYRLGEPPALGMVTFVDTRHTHSPNPGYCYQRAGWRRVGKTKGGLVALQLLPADMPDVEAPLPTALQPTLWA